MVLRALATALSLTWIASAAAAAPVAPTVLQNGFTVQETVNIEDDSGLLNDANWFTFAAAEGQSIDIDINRLAAPPDLFAAIYFGNVAGIDFGDRNADNRSVSSVPGLTYLGFSDDAEDDAFGGPYGDPRFVFNAPAAGIYSFYVSVYTQAQVGYAFEVSGAGLASVSNEVPPVPLPAPLGMLLAGVGSFVWLRKRSQHTSRLNA